MIELTQLSLPASKTPAPAPASPTEPGVPEFWRSLEHLEETPEFLEFLHREFPQAASEFPTGVSRRRWLQLMGASLTLAGVAGCWEKQTIAPFVNRPANRIPGVGQLFASAYEIAGVSKPTLVTSYDGRPIKVDGNGDHPSSTGAAEGYLQAATLHLYDPDRSGGVVEIGAAHGKGHDHEAPTWKTVFQQFGTILPAARSAQGAGLAVLAEVSSSPTRERLRQRFLEVYPQARWYEYEPVNFDGDRLSTEKAFGRRLRTVLDVAPADVILTLDCDLFHQHPQGDVNTRAWANRRDPAVKEPGKAMNRLYAVESQYTSVGSGADHRLPLPSSSIGEFVLALEQAIDNNGVPAGDGAGAAYAKFLAAVAGDLNGAKGSSLVVCGFNQPVDVQARVHRINGKLQNIGRTVRYIADPLGDRPTSTQAIAALVGEMNAGRVTTLFVLGGNPVYNAPADLKFADAYAKVKNRLHLSQYVDETSLASTWHLPRADQLESWGDGRTWDGRLTLRQPLITPIYDGLSDVELLAHLVGEQQTGGERLVRATVNELLPADGRDAAWRKLVHDGFLEGEEVPAAEAPLAAAMDLQTPARLGDDQYELVFHPSSSTFDGRFANNGWLQEAPDLLTKIVWDNAAIISKKTADKLGAKMGTVLRITLGDNTVEAPAYILPGQATGSIGLALGYGRTAAGHVGGLVSDKVEPVGFNAYRLLTSAAGAVAAGAKVVATGRTFLLATTQDHHLIDTLGQKEVERRAGPLVRQGTLDEFDHHPDFARHMVHHPPLESLWTERSPEGRAWGMSIDLSKCIGCNACVVACQAENNVPIVGKDQVSRGREMHWLRIDRYFRGDVDDPESLTQPMLCQHCENAPCEQVCPVAATTHSTEGLNDMAYNRCIGTRYCANNCPYKVRRFNFLDFNRKYEVASSQLSLLQLNPEVTVRERGVMEKCTFCVQRIQNVKITAKNEQRDIRDGEIKTACQQACPAGAIVFGDLADPTSQVAKDHASPRSYGVLAELNTKPRTQYLARIRNPHPSLGVKVANPSHGGHGEGGHGDEGHGGAADGHHPKGTQPGGDTRTERGRDDHLRQDGQTKPVTDHK